MLIFNLLNLLKTLILVGIILLIVNKTILHPDRIARAAASKFIYYLIISITLMISFLITLIFSPKQVIVFLTCLVYALSFIGLYLLLDKVLRKSINFLAFTQKIALIVHPIYLTILARIGTLLAQLQIFTPSLLQGFLVELVQVDIHNQNSAVVNKLLERIGTMNSYDLAYACSYVTEDDGFGALIRTGCSHMEELKSLKIEEF